MLKKSIAITLSMLVFSTPIYADTIIKRNGEQIEGKIINITMEYVILEEGAPKGREWMVIDTRSVELGEILRIYTGSKETTALFQPYKLQRKTITIEQRRIVPGALIFSTSLTIFCFMQYNYYRDNSNRSDFWRDMGDTDKSSYYKNRAGWNKILSYASGFGAIFCAYLTFNGKKYEIHFLDN